MCDRASPHALWLCREAGGTMALDSATFATDPAVIALSEDVMLILRPLFALSLVAALVAWPALAPAQTWPQRTVRFILTLGPGSGTDIGTRLLGDRLTKKWNQPVVVENKPGGDGIVAINAFVAANDDHVLLAAPSSSFTAHPYQHDNLSYKPGDLQPIARVSNTIIVLAVPASLDVKSVKELVDMARAQPGKLNWVGTTGALDFIFAGFLKTNGLNMTKVPYRNPVEAVNDLAEGRVQAYLTALAIARPQLQAGKIKVIAIPNTTRAPTHADIPTVKEAGHPELTFDGLVGFFGPAGMPLALRERIAADVREVMASDPLVNERLNLTGQLPNPGGPAEFGKAIDEQRAKLAVIAKELGLKQATQ
jgi:tripartite-type tricarboxylate transporter receptor subunit TctC